MKVQFWRFRGVSLGAISIIHPWCWFFAPTGRVMLEVGCEGVDTGLMKASPWPADFSILQAQAKIIMCIPILNKEKMFKVLSTLRTLKTLMKVSVYAHSTLLIMSHTSSTSQMSRSRSFVAEMEGCKLASKRPAARSAIIALVHASKC